MGMFRLTICERKEGGIKEGKEEGRDRGKKEGRKGGREEGRKAVLTKSYSIKRCLQKDIKTTTITI
jgi:predicted transposase YdaD